MKITTLFFCLTVLYLPALAQPGGNVQGIAFDSSVRQPVADATITVMKKADSSLVTFTMTGSNGKFVLTGMKEGSYRLLVTHVNYHNASLAFTIGHGHPQTDLGNIFLVDKSKLLQEVVVTPEQAPVTLLGDTIQYNAGSFKTQPHATVEDLLKKLPGIKVDKDGSVKAQGEKVQKVLVDGKEFFGNDTKIATRNLPADAIDKVQVFDKLSDQAQVTGFDDGNSRKTINLTLKKDRKKGAFGKVSAGAGTDGRYQEKFNANQFKGARQLSAIGMANNTNAEGFSFIDVLNFTGALNQLKNGGNINISVAEGDPLAGLLGGNNTGINTTRGGGVNYNNLIGTKTDFQGNYFYSHYNPVRTSNIQRQYFSPANLYTQDAHTDNTTNSNRFNASADYQIDSFNSVKVSSGINYQHAWNKTLSDYTTRSARGTSINDGNSNSLSDQEGATFSTTVLYRKKFSRKRRSFSLNLLTNLDNSQGTGSLQSLTNFYDSSGSQLHDAVNQVSRSRESLQGFNARAVYTEPLFKKSLLEFSAGKSYSVNAAGKTTYDYNRGNGKFDLVNNLLTNNFTSTYNSATAGLRLRKQTGKYNYALGAAWQQATLKGQVISGVKDSAISKSFGDILPSARFQYVFSRSRNIIFNYSTATTQPTIIQLQPIADNSNPLYIKLGNPNLKQEFTHTLRVTSSFADPYKNNNFFAFFTAQQTQNKIVNYDRINSRGVDSVAPVNVNGVFNLNGNLSYGLPVHAVKGMLDISAEISRYRGKQFVNGKANRINTTAFGPQVRLDMNPSDKLNLAVSTGITVSHTGYSLPSAPGAKYLVQAYGAEAGWQLPHGFFFATDIDYRVVKQYQNGFSTKVPLWNAALSIQMLHYSRGELKVSANDLLNRNLSVTRSASQNYIEDSRINGLRRFFLLSFTYNLTKTGAGNTEGGNGHRMIMR